MKKILSDLAAHLESLREDGELTVNVSRDVLRALGQPPAPSSLSRAPVRTTHPPPARQPQSPGPGSQSAHLDEIARRVEECERCALHKGRTRTVPGQGNPHPEILFVGEAPGADEDLQGLAFVGRAGQLLTKMIEAMGYTRDQVFIANIAKCRPPNNRPPLPEEMAACLPYLKEQIALLKPKIIVALGATAVKGLLNTTIGISRLRGNWQKFEGIDVMPTFHPSYLLRVPSAKHEAWDDLKAVLAKLGRTAPPRRGGSD